MNTPPPLNAPQLFGMFLAALIAVWVMIDATKRGKDTVTALGWSVGVFLLLIVFLPLYLFFRARASLPDWNSAPQATTSCRYCGGSLVGAPNYCPHCSRQLKSSTEIHPTS